MVGGLHSIRRKNKGKNLGRHLELSERRRVFSGKIWPTSCVPLGPKCHRAQSARAEHRITAQVLVWRLRWAQHVNRERRRGGEEAPTRKIPRQEPPEDGEDGWKKSSGFCKAAVLNLFWAFFRKLETCVREDDQTASTST